MPINKESKVFGVIKRVLWDTMRVLSTKKKTNFILSASSKAFSRMQIMDCIRKKFDPTDLEGNDKSHVIIMIIITTIVIMRIIFK